MTLELNTHREHSRSTQTHTLSSLRSAPESHERSSFCVLYYGVLVNGGRLASACLRVLLYKCTCTRSALLITSIVHVCAPVRVCRSLEPRVRARAARRAQQVLRHPHHLRRRPRVRGTPAPTVLHLHLHFHHLSCHADMHEESCKTTECALHRSTIACSRAARVPHVFLCTVYCVLCTRPRPRHCTLCKLTSSITKTRVLLLQYTACTSNCCINS